MKNIVLILAAFMCSLSFSQQKGNNFLVKKKTTEISGNIHLWHNSQEREDFKTTFFNFNFMPSFGYAITDNLIIGVGGAYGNGYHKNNDFNEKRSTQNSYSIFPYVKTYFPVSKKFAFSLTGEFRYTHRDNKYNTFDVNNNFVSSSLGTQNEYFVGLRPGVNLFITKRLILNANLGAVGYSKVKGKEAVGEDSESAFTSTSFNFSLNNTNLSTGLTFLLI
ncbi:hypothetical protein MHTCC0001_14690 [Flavobacteriaceae bacterium MHTCC 0001]